MRGRGSDIGGAMEQQQLRSDSSLSRRIVRSFLHFLTSVEPAAGVDVEGLEVAKQCLAEAFNLDPSSANIIPDGDSLIHLFQSHGSTDPGTTPTTTQNTQASHTAEGDDWRRDKHVPDLPTDELFGQFIGALEQIHYFKSTPDGNDDPVQMDRASSVFYTAVEGLQRSGCETLHPKDLAESLKSQGNKAMQSNHFSEAIEFYTFAIALNLNNAVYYCNRAAAFTQIHQYAEAIDDCLKALKIDPNYSKAYSRLGFAYYAQGNYADAIEKGFIKALRLDPNNEYVKENMRVAEQKLREYRRAQHSQSSGSSSRHEQPNHQSAGARPFNINDVTPELASYIENMAQRLQSQRGPGDGIHDNEGTGIGGNININFGGQMPAENHNSSSGQPNHQSAEGPRVAAMPDFASFFMNTTQGRHSHGGPGADIHADNSGTGIGGNFNVNFGEQMPAEESAANRNGQPNQQSAGGPRTAMPFNLNDLTPEVASIFSNMSQGWHSHGPEDDNPGREGNININLGEQMSAEVGVALRSVMEMFSGATPGPGGGEDNVNRRPSS